jgi:hypothetical protein
MIKHGATATPEWNPGGEHEEAVFKFQKSEIQTLRRARHLAVSGSDHCWKSHEKATSYAQVEYLFVAEDPEDSSERAALLSDMKG